MYKPTLILACFILVGLLGRAAPAAQKSQFEKIREPLAKLTRVTMDGSALRIDRASWEAQRPAPPQGAAANPAGMVVRVGFGQTGLDKIFQDLRNAAGGGGCSMSTSMNTRSLSFRGNNGLGATIQTDPSRVQISLSETENPGYSLGITDGGKGMFRLIFTDNQDALVLITQTPKRVRVIQVDGDQIHIEKAASFGQLYRARPELMDRLIPALRRVGVGLFPPRLDPAMVRMVCRKLRPPSIAERADFAKLLKQMDDDDFDTREAATKAMNKDYARFAEQVADALKAPRSEEVKARLEKIAAAGMDKSDLAPVVLGLGLLDDTRYLVDVLEKVNGIDRDGVLARLKKLTGKDIGPDPAAWRAALPRPRK